MSSIRTRAFAPFYPHGLLRDKHMMTIAGSKLPRPVGPFLDLSEDFWLPVDDHTSVRVETHWQRDLDAPVLILVHGLSGSARSPYMVSTAQKAVALGWSVLRLNIRNCGGTERATPTLYNAALTEDVDALVAWVERHHPHSPMAIAGFSLGGSIALHSAAQWGDSPPHNLLGLVTVSTPLNLVNTCRAMHTGVMNRFYMKIFLDGFVRALRNKAEEYPELYPYDAPKGYKDFYTFDDMWTAPSFGYSGANDYYNRASAFRVLHQVATPMLLIHAEDDPLVPYNKLSLQAIEANPYTRLLMTKYGGHCAFFAKEFAVTPHWRDRDRWWAENRLLEFFTGLLQEKVGRLPNIGAS